MGRSSSPATRVQTPDFWPRSAEITVRQRGPAPPFDEAMITGSRICVWPPGPRVVRRFWGWGSPDNVVIGRGLIMASTAPVAVAIGVGYVLGRSHKLRWAVLLGTA